MTDQQTISLNEILIGPHYPAEFRSIKLIFAAYSEVVFGTYRQLFATGFLFAKSLPGRRTHPST
jgi:hypothetical protein